MTLPAEPVTLLRRSSALAESTSLPPAFQTSMLSLPLLFSSVIVSAPRLNSAFVAVKARPSNRSFRRKSATVLITSSLSTGAMVKTSGRDASLAKSSAFSVDPSVSVALELPVLTVIVPVGFVEPVLRQILSFRVDDALHLGGRQAFERAFDCGEVRTNRDRRRESPIGSALCQARLRRAAGELESIDLVAIEDEDPAIAQRERVLVERGVEERRDQEHPLLIGEAGVEVAAGRRLLADLEVLEVLLALRPEGDLEARGLESVLLQVRRVLVDHAVDLERGEAARDRRELARIRVGFTGSTTCHLPSVFWRRVVSPSALLICTSSMSSACNEPNGFSLTVAPPGSRFESTK